MLNSALKLTCWLAVPICAILVCVVDDTTSFGGHATALVAPEGPALAPECDRSLTCVSSAPELSSEAGSRRVVDEPVLDTVRWIEGLVEFPNGHNRAAPTWIVARGAAHDRALDSTRDFRALVDADGRFRVAYAPETERGELLLDAPTLVLAGRHWVVLGPEVPAVVLRPSLAGVLRCRVEPVAGTSLPPDLVAVLIRPPGQSPGGQNRLVATEDGAFEARQLSPGTAYELEITGNGVLAERRSSLSVTAGETTDVSVQLRAGLRLALDVTDDRGAPVEDFEVTATPLPLPELHGALPHSLHAQAVDGSAQITGLVAGTWSIHVAARGHVSSEREVTVVAPTTYVEVSLWRAGRIEGQVVDPEGQPVADAWVTCATTPSELRVGVEGDEDRPRCRVLADGRFELTDVAPGEASAMALADEFAPSATARVDLAPGERRGPLVLRLRRFGAISGRVDDVIGVEALDVHELASGRRWTVETDLRGRFLIERLVPGDFDLTLLRGGSSPDGNAAPSPTRTSSYRATVAEGRMTEVVLRFALDNRTSLGVEVRLAGMPVAGAWVECCRIALGRGMRPEDAVLAAGETDEIGRVELDLPREGANYVLKVTLAAGRRARLPIDVRGDADEEILQDVPIEVPPGQSYTNFVVRIEPRPSDE